MRWQVISDRPLYRDEWLDIRVAEVELPDGHRFGHRWIRTPPGAGVIAVDGGGQVLLIWRHRFITDTWGWELPMGRIEEGEQPADAAAREFEEETGWRAGPLRHLIDVQPTPGLSNSVHHIYRASEAVRVGSPTDATEAARIAWVPLAQVRSLIGKGDITSGSTLTALLYVLSETQLPGAAGRDGPGCDARAVTARAVTEPGRQGVRIDPCALPGVPGTMKEPALTAVTPGASPGRRCASRFPASARHPAGGRYRWAE